MDYKIYLIEDSDGLKYIGSTKQTLKQRLSAHRHHKKINHGCSSELLNLDNCSITELECCNKENKKDREQYWINQNDCVNVRKLDGIFNQEYHKNYTAKHREKINNYMKEYSKQRWFCPNCKIDIRITNKSNHFKTQTHQLNKNIYIDKDEVCY